MQYICQLVPIPDRVKRRPHLLFIAISSQILRCFLRARLTLLILFILAIATFIKVFTSFWNWGSFDGYAIVFAVVSFFVGFPLVQMFEEFFHAAVPVAKGQPDWLKGMLVANMYARDRKTILVFMFVAIQHQGNWSPLDSFHISAAGPLGVLAIAGLGFIALLIYRLFGGANILYPLLAILPFAMNGLLALVPTQAWFKSDGGNMAAMSRQIGLGPLQFFKELLRSVGLVASYLGRYVLGRARVQLILLLSVTIVWVCFK